MTTLEILKASRAILGRIVASITAPPVTKCLACGGASVDGLMCAACRGWRSLDRDLIFVERWIDATSAYRRARAKDRTPVASQPERLDPENPERLVLRRMGINAGDDILWAERNDGTAYIRSDIAIEALEKAMPGITTSEHGPTCATRSATFRHLPCDCGLEDGSDGAGAPTP